tara:strand:- start:136 stop:351 length:216 start_codon:yes stop_codon:yes gene_type:complete
MKLRTAINTANTVNANVPFNGDTIMVKISKAQAKAIAAEYLDYESNGQGEWDAEYSSIAYMDDYGNVTLGS